MEIPDHDRGVGPASEPELADTIEPKGEATPPADRAMAVGPVPDPNPRSVFARCVDAYFTPNRLESEGLYRALGVKLFKKYTPTSGDLVRRHVWNKIHFLNASLAHEPDRLEALQKFEEGTRSLETIHLGGFALLATLDIEGGDYNSPKRLALDTGIQLAVNVYPIMLQRYNRMRALRAIRKLTGKPEEQP